MSHARIPILFAMSLVASACGAAPPSSGEPPLSGAESTDATSQAATGKRQLKVALFPYLPADVDGKAGLARLRDMLEAKFEEQNPRIDLKLADFDPDAPEFYDKAGLAGWLRNGTYDVIEIDTLMLGEVASELAEWSSPARFDWHPAGREAITYRGRTYGVPHLLCGHFVYTRDPNVVKARNVMDFADRLKAMPKPAAKLGARFRGSFNLPSFFLDAYEDGHPGASLDGLIARPEFPDQQLVNGLGALVRTCAVGGTNPCLDDSYPDATVAMDDFAIERTGAYIGYSESLHRILMKRKDTAPIYVASAPMGAGSYPLLFTDALVRRKACNGACARDAQTFADFLDAPATMELLMMGDDLESGVARYLLPATKSAFKAPRVAANATYRELERAIRVGEPLPNHDFYDHVVDGTRSKAMLEALKKVQ
ncbi:hypothetical protein [Pendulispora albinea]|uniref:Extracellular solute-binding protein n=1 Tax=Pendulispora albinea TaxID=2741071 RepID=A0ABZ2LW15_9BACT